LEDNSPFTANTEYWDGTSWTEVADLATARDSIAAGYLRAALAAGGFTGTTATEEWTAPDVVINTLTTS
jgi:hypothetical protein